MHCESKSHLDQAKSLKSQSRLSFSTQSREDIKRMKAELQMAVLTTIPQMYLYQYMIDSHL